MRIPDWVQEVLASFDQKKEAHGELQVVDELERARKTHGDLSDEDFKGYPLPFPPGVIAITFRLPSFETEHAPRVVRARILARYVRWDEGQVNASRTRHHQTEAIWLEGGSQHRRRENFCRWKL
jgi:hypothetical protein